MSDLLACVIVPARDEEELIGACIAALAAQVGVAKRAYEVVLVLDRCTDATEARARAAAGAMTLHVLHATHPGVGHARRQGMDFAAERLRPAGLIATTDADSEPLLTAHGLDHDRAELAQELFVGGDAPGQDLLGCAQPRFTHEA